MYSPAPVFTRQKVYAHPPPHPTSLSQPSLILTIFTMKSTPFSSYCSHRWIYCRLEYSVQSKFVCPQHTTRKPYLSLHHTLATSLVLVFSYYMYLVLRAVFRGFSFFSCLQLQKLTRNIFPHLGCDKFSSQLLSLPEEHPLIRVPGKYRKTSRLQHR